MIELIASAYAHPDAEATYLFVDGGEVGAKPVMRVVTAPRRPIECVHVALPERDLP